MGFGEPERCSDERDSANRGHRIIEPMEIVSLDGVNLILEMHRWISVQFVVSMYIYHIGVFIAEALKRRCNGVFCSEIPGHNYDIGIVI